MPAASKEKCRTASDVYARAKSGATLWTQEIALCIRTILKRHWSHVKFSVRSSSFSGGSSIHVEWVDGPVTSEVNRLVRPFNTAGFDGTIDMQYSRSFWLLPEGYGVFRSCEGTQGSMGIVQAHASVAPDSAAVPAEACRCSVHPARHIGELRKLQIQRWLLEHLGSIHSVDKGRVLTENELRDIAARLPQAESELNMLRFGSHGSWLSGMVTAVAEGRSTFKDAPAFPCDPDVPLPGFLQ